MVWKSLLVLYSRDVLTDLVTIHHGQSRWQYCTQVSSMLFGEAISGMFLRAIPLSRRERMMREVRLHGLFGCVQYRLHEVKISVFMSTVFCNLDGYQNDT